MDRILRPARFETDPHSPNAGQEWTHWFVTFENFISTIENICDADKLKLLINFVSHSNYQLFSEYNTYDEAIQTLRTTFVKPKNFVFARYRLATRKQQPGESIDQFVQSLKQLSQDCNFEPVNAETYRDNSIRDAFINGLSCPLIRQRLLENNNLSLIAATDQARALEDAKRNSDGYLHANHVNAMVEKFDTDEQCAAIKKNEVKCYFCGRIKHPRRACPAKDATCNNCGKQGHWSKVCRSANKKHHAASDESDRHTSASLILTAAVSECLRKTTTSVTVNGKRADALIDTGSTETFIDKQFAKNSFIEVFPSKTSIRMANTSLSSFTTGHCFVDLKLQDHLYKHRRISVLPDLCADIIVGLDVLSHHSKLEIDFGGNQIPLKICCVAQAVVEPPTLFSNLSTDCRPIATKSRKHNLDDETFIKNEISKLLRDGIIEESKSPWRAQVLVTKNERHKRRMVIDYSQTINRFTYLDAYPLPTIEEIVSKVSQSKIFSTIDLKSAYHQIPILEQEKQYTAFQALGQLYQFRRVPFGVTNGVAAFQRVMDGIIRKENLEGVYAYLDDVTICGKTQNEHDKNLKAFMQGVEKYGLTLNYDKCSFSKTSICLLGYLIENGMLKPDPSRMEPLMKLPLPTDTASLRRTIGMFAHYSKWIPRFSEKISHLVNTKSFPLSQDAADDFDDLKSAILKSAVSAIDSNIPFVVETDASDHSIAATLSQSGRPVAFFSRMLSPSELKHAAVEKEACAIVESLKKWRHYLLGRHFTLYTDQRSVAFMFDKTHTSKIKNDKIQRWRIELSCFSYDIIYRPGSENGVADTLSRICGATQSEQTLNQLHQNLCHPGVTRMYHWIRNRNLPYSLQEIRNLNSSCKICSEIKPRFHKNTSGKLIKATSPFERLNIDFKGPLPTNTRNQYLLTIVDEYSRFPFAVPCPDTSADSVIKSLDPLFATFGLPSFIHSDQGSAFMSKELKSYLNSLGIATSRTTPYNPQGNGQVERYNGIIWKAVTMALKTRNLKTTEWELVLNAALHSIRSLLCTATNCTPHERMFHHSRRTPTGTSMPSWLVAGPVLLKRHVRQSKYDPLVDEVELIEANPQYAVVRNNDGRELTVSIKHLAPKTIDIQNTDTPEPATVTSDQPNEISTIQEVADNSSPRKLESSQFESNSSTEDIRTNQPIRCSQRIKRKPIYLEDFELN